LRLESNCLDKPGLRREFAVARSDAAGARITSYSIDREDARASEVRGAARELRGLLDDGSGRFGSALSASHQRLAHLEEKMAPHHFLRVRKSAIVNSARISEIRPMFDGVYDIVLAEGTVVTSSRRYAHKLRAVLES
jgi:hypothetical protein